MKMKRINYSEDKEFILNFGNIKVIMPKYGKNGDLYDVAFNFLEMWIESKYVFVEDKFDLDTFKKVVFDSVIDSTEEAFNTVMEMFKNEE